MAEITSQIPLESVDSGVELMLHEYDRRREILQAYKDGYRIWMRPLRTGVSEVERAQDPSGWVEDPHPTWNFEVYEYEAGEMCLLTKEVSYMSGGIIRVHSLSIYAFFKEEEEENPRHERIQDQVAKNQVPDNVVDGNGPWYWWSPKPFEPKRRTPPKGLTPGKKKKKDGDSRVFKSLLRDGDEVLEHLLNG